MIFIFKLTKPGSMAVMVHVRNLAFFLLLYCEETVCGIYFNKFFLSNRLLFVIYDVKAAINC